MTRAKALAVQAKDPTPPVATVPPQGVAELALDSVVLAATTVQNYSKLFGEVDVGHLHGSLSQMSSDLLDGDVSQLERMLLNQALTLEVIFHATIQKSAVQQNPVRSDALMVLALKAQSNSRATIAALTDLKYPRQVSFVRQTNVSQGAQQVNNGAPQASLPSGKPKRSVALPAPVAVIGMAPVETDDVIKTHVPRSRARVSSR
jgi:hypothetical protein